MVPGDQSVLTPVAKVTSFMKIRGNLTRHRDLCLFPFENWVIFSVDAWKSPCNCLIRSDILQEFYDLNCKLSENIHSWGKFPFEYKIDIPLRTHSGFMVDYHTTASISYNDMKLHTFVELSPFMFFLSYWSLEGEIDHLNSRENTNLALSRPKCV